MLTLLSMEKETIGECNLIASPQKPLDEFHWNLAYKFLSMTRCVCPKTNPVRQQIWPRLAESRPSLKSLFALYSRIYSKTGDPIWSHAYKGKIGTKLVPKWTRTPYLLLSIKLFSQNLVQTMKLRLKHHRRHNVFIGNFFTPFRTLVKRVSPSGRSTFQY